MLKIIIRFGGIQMYSQKINFQKGSTGKKFEPKIVSRIHARGFHTQDTLSSFELKMSVEQYDLFSVYAVFSEQLPYSFLRNIFHIATLAQVGRLPFYNRDHDRLFELILMDEVGTGAFIVADSDPLGPAHIFDESGWDLFPLT